MASGPIRSWLNTLGWAVYLGCSWTWCIGMFLPVLLVRDFGPAGFWVFAIPNAIGAAAMGWVMRNRQMSSRIVHEHRTACICFSMVTGAFQMFFLVGYVRMLSIYLLIVGLIVFAIIGAYTQWKTKARLACAVVVLIISIAAICVFLWIAPKAPSGPMSSHGTGGLLSLSIVCLFGFALCPYLDLTFHRAIRLQSPAGARAAFSAGFGVLFFGLIFFSFVYAPHLIPFLSGQFHSTPAWLKWTVGLHMAVQCGLTMAIHFQADRTSKPLFSAVPLRARYWGFLLPFVLFTVAIGLDLSHFRSDLNVEEINYRLFMSFYALVFPAYVWLCMIPGRSRRAILTFIIAATLASPFFFIAFILDKMPYAIPGLAIVVLARIFIPTSRADAPVGHRNSMA